jgi:glycerol kinase
MGRRVLAVDQGTTGTTAVVLDDEAGVSGRAYAEHPQLFPRPGWVEHDPAAIWATTRDVMHAALDDGGCRSSDLAAIGITNQRETTILWDRATGQPVANAIVWQDRRTAPMCDALQARGLADLVRARTGLRIDAYFSATKIAWLLDHVDGLRARAERGEIVFGTVDSWLLHRMSGGRVHATDVTNASRTMLFDLRRLDWDDELLAELAVPRAVLPEVHPSQHVFTETDPVATGLDTSVPVAAVLGDQQAALFAQACFDPGQAKNTYGTGSFVLLNTGAVPAAEDTTMITTIAAGVEGEATSYALEGPIFVTGSAVQWLRDGLGLIERASDTEALATSVPDTGGVCFVPALAGLGAPYWDPYARGALLGVTRGTTRAHVVRAVLEGIAWSTVDVVTAMQRETSIAIAELRVDGGAVANGFLMQHQADVLGIPVDVPAQIESTSLGSGLMAGLATGVWRDRDEIAAMRRTARRYEPAMAAAERDAAQDRWSDAVRRSRAWSTDGAP